MEVSIFDISTHPSVCVFGHFKVGSDGGRKQKDIDFSINSIKSHFATFLILGYMKRIIVPYLLQFLKSSKVNIGKIRRQIGSDEYKYNIIRHTRG